MSSINFLSQKHKSGTSQEKIDEIFFIFVQADKELLVRLLEEINKELELEAFLSKENNNTDSTDDIFDFLSQICNSAQEEFDKLLSGNSDIKRFIRALSKTLTLLLNTRVDTAEKNKVIIKIDIEQH